MEFIFGSFVGVIFGCMVTMILVRIYTRSGVLYVDSRDPLEKPSVFMELNEDVTDLINSDYVRLRVCNIRHNSHQ